MSVADWLTLTGAPGVGPRTVTRLLEHFGDPAAILQAPKDTLGKIGLKPPAIAALGAPDQAWIDSILSWAQRPGAHILPRDDPRYPPLLAEIADAPTILYVQGDPLLLSEPQIAIVGSRNPSPVGRQVTQELATRLASHGLIITSGLALGVDGAAHIGALKGGRTIAVLGTGPDQVYPAVHRDLALQIADRGALVSEFTPGSGPLARNFPRRNRIISGLSLGTLVTEAAIKSGSLITARQALEQGREVFAVPGSIRNPLARGCHALIRDGARLVEEADDILVELAPLLRGLLNSSLTPITGCPQTHAQTSDEPQNKPGRTIDPDYLQLLDAMGYDPVTADELIRSTGLPADSLSSMLLVLELEGHVSSCGGGRYCRTD